MNMPALTEAEALSLLEFYALSGVTEATACEPLDYRTLATSPPPQMVAQPEQHAHHNAPERAPSQKSAAVPRSAKERPVLLSPSKAIAEAEAAANAATTLDTLYHAIQMFDGCPLKHTATHTVTHDGNPQADVMIIGEAPGAEEDRHGIPFCGASGQLLDAMFAAIGLERATNLYITNMIFWRPPGNRNPTPEEIAICKPFVMRHIQLIQPKAIILTGGISAQEMLGASTGITRLRGTIHELRTSEDAAPIPALPILHPAYLLRQPAQKKLAWQDMLSLRQHLANL